MVLRSLKKRKRFTYPAKLKVEKLVLHGQETNHLGWGVGDKIIPSGFVKATIGGTPDSVKSIAG